MDLLEQTALVEDLEVAADGHVGHAQLAHEVGDADRPVLADAIEDEGLALPCEHQCAVPSSPRRLTMDDRPPVDCSV